jgi:CPA2 family monovalent cation:H+ antiporter-2
LGIITALTKIATGYFAASQAGVDKSARWRAGVTLVARGEFSMVIAALGATLQPELGSFAAAYVLFLVVLGPVLARLAK